MAKTGQTICKYEAKDKQLEQIWFAYKTWEQ